LIGFLRGQPINLYMQPTFPMFSRNQGTPKKVFTLLGGKLS